MIEAWKEWWEKQHNTQVGGYNRMEGYMYDAFKAGWDAALEKPTPIKGHAEDCALNEDGPCTCGTEEILEELAREEAGLTDEDFK